MRKHHLSAFLLVTFALFVLLVLPLKAQHQHQPNANNENVHNGNYLYFVENKNQWNDNIRYRAELNAGRLYLENNRLTYLLIDPQAIDAIHECHHTQICDPNEVTVKQHAFYVNFVGANNQPKMHGFCPSDAYRNYYIGNNESKWATNVKQFREITYQSMYLGVDMRLYGEEGNIKYDFIVAPKADAKQIVMRYEGANEVKIENDKLLIKTSVNTIAEQKPYAYQYINKQLVTVPCKFEWKNEVLTFAFPDGYNDAYELIIDPTLIFASYSGATSDNWGFTATYDLSGHLYAGSAAFDFGYPTTSGAFQSSFGGGNTDIAISKFSPSGNSLVYSTYIGGSRSELPHSLVVNNANELFVLGTTSSNNYPTTNGAYDQSFNGGESTSVSNISYSNGSDIVVTKLSANGANLIASTFVGGSENDGLNEANDLRYNYADEARGEIFLDPSGKVYVASCTQSNNFPTTLSAVQPNYGGGSQDGCLFRLSANLNDLMWSTFIGGSSADAAYSVKLADNGSVFACGGTKSSNFPTTTGVVKPNYGGGDADGWLASLTNSGSTMLAATYLGTNEYDQCFFVDIDEEGNLITVGQTEGNYTVTAGVYSNNNSGQFLHKLNSTLTNTDWSTVFGNGNGAPNISITAFLVDVCNHIYVSGWGGDTNFGVSSSTTEGMPVTSDAYQSNTDGSDFYFVVFKEDAPALEYATFFGGAGGFLSSVAEHVDGGTSRFDKQGIIYQAVCAGCGGSDAFPTTSGAWSNTNNSFNCNLGVIKFDFQIPIVFAVAQPNPASSGCTPLTVQFDNTSINATDYFWDFGVPGATSTAFEPTYTYTETGAYEVMLIADDPDACNEADTTYLTVIALNPDDFTADFESVVDCEAVSASFESNYEVGVSYQWSFGDGASSTTATPTHEYAAPGLYEVTLTLTSTVPNCPTTATVTQTVEIADVVLANPEIGSLWGCVPYNAQFVNTSINATDYVWNFGDGSPVSTDFEPIHQYAAPGNYVVSLTANNPLSCNLTNVDSIVVTALDTVILANFFSTVADPCDGPMATFNTFYPAYHEFNWDFGDGNTSTVGNPTHVYDEPGTYEVTLIVSSPCAPPDTTAQTITLEVPDIVTGEIVVPPGNGCAPHTIHVEGMGNAVAYQWNFGDGTTAEGLVATHTYEQAGNYELQFIAIDSSTCNITDVISVPVAVYQEAIAAFEISTDIVEAGQTVFFTNQSQFATSYMWDLGDGNTSVDENPIHTYSATGELLVCLMALNEGNCNDTICLPITVIPPIFIGVPNAFSPNDDNLNDVLWVEGRNSIDYMELKIYNRWGELIFQTTDPNEAWDGTYKNEAQEMEVYAYTLVANLISGRQYSEQGNITLVR